MDGGPARRHGCGDFISTILARKGAGVSVYVVRHRDLRLRACHTRSCVDSGRKPLAGDPKFFSSRNVGLRCANPTYVAYAPGNKCEHAFADRVQGLLGALPSPAPSSNAAGSVSHAGFGRAPVQGGHVARRDPEATAGKRLPCTRQRGRDGSKPAVQARTRARSSKSIIATGLPARQASASIEALSPVTSSASARRSNAP